jgi:hypothetical protein
LSLLLCLASAEFPAAAETRIALIIGNSDYASANLRLANPANDAVAMQRALKDAGFVTIVKLNARRVDFYRAVDDFAAQIGRDPHAVGLFYYAGHGVQADGTNYLIPVDASIESDADLEANAFDAGRVLRAMKTAQNEMNIVILDACRDNPLPKTRGAERGLARMDAPSGTFIAYAAAPGQTAHDGAKGANGVFTGELVRAMAEPGVPLEQMFKKVIAGVRADTHGGQQPWSEASIQGDFYFHAALARVESLHAGTDPQQIELAFWTSIENSRDASDFQTYLRKYPRGIFAGLAQNRLKFLQAPVPQHTAAKPAPLAAAEPNPAVKKTPDERCESILQRAQLGETLNEEERGYLKGKCH